MKAQKVLILCLFALTGTLALNARTHTLGNKDFKSDIVFKGHRICSVSVIDCKSGKELTNPGAAPVFEICVDGTVLKASDPVWCFAGESRKTLSNDGIVVTYEFKGRGKWKDLRLAWDREYFPTGAFIRERLRIKTGGARKPLTLTNLDGANHLMFPRYAFACDGDVRAKELRIADFRKKRSFPEHYMFHPDSTLFTLGAAPRAVKGPFLILDAPEFKIVSSYEHASQDKVVWGKKASKQSNEGNDGSQGVEGEIFKITDDDLWFIATSASLANGSLALSNNIRHGGYLDGEALPTEEWYETVWSTINILPPDADENKAIGEYLFSRITENAESRVADFYYNTWGLQRQTGTLYPVMNEERLKEEMRYAAECGVTTFVVDDGWHECFGHWVCNPERIPSGLRALCSYMDSLGLRPGIWLSLPGAGASTERALAHPEWLIRDASGEPIKAQWKNPVYDIVGPYYDELLADLKALVDEGFRFFKWDAMNLFSSTLPGLWHGDERWTAHERADRYNYLLPFYVTKMMRELREYCPGVVVEMDMTEPERCMMGLMVLQEGKYYFINNGASKYGDYSVYRSKSVRSVINEYGRFMPQELFTYAYYPNDVSPWFAEKYNITSSLSAGHGIWGNLALMSESQRAVCKGLFDKASKVLPHVRGSLVEVTGKVGGSPEIYLQRNRAEGYALLTAFSGEGLSEPYLIEVQTSEVLGVLGHPYKLGPEGVELSLDFGKTDDCRSAFVIGGKGSGAQVYSSTGELDAIEPVAAGLRVTAATDSEVSVGMPDGRVLTRFIPASASALFE